MAKRKHASALFEVFHENKSPARPSSASRGYGWWFKGRMQAAAPDAPAEASDPNDPTTMTIRSPLLASRIAAFEAMDPTPPPKPVVAPKPVSAPARPIAEPADEIIPVRTRHIDRMAQLESPARFHLDPDTREMTLRVPLNTALITAFALLMCVGIVYVIGRHIGNSEGVASATAAAELADENRAAELRPDSLDVPRHVAKAITPVASVAKSPVRKVEDDARTRDRDEGAVVNGVRVTPPAPRSVNPLPDEPRMIGLNYLLIQNYPNQAIATEARDFLVQNGIACTVEKVPAGFYCPDPAWMSVITARGFDKEGLHSTEYDDFKHQIEKLGDKFAGNGKFKRFSIQVYKLK